jgi:hypothetical protein
MTIDLFVEILKSAMIRDLLILVDVIRQHSEELKQQSKHKSELLKTLRDNKELFQQHPYQNFLNKLTKRDIWIILDTEFEVRSINETKFCSRQTLNCCFLTSFSSKGEVNGRDSSLIQTRINIFHLWNQDLHTVIVSLWSF